MLAGWRLPVASEMWSASEMRRLERPRAASSRISCSLPESRSSSSPSTFSRTERGTARITFSPPLPWGAPGPPRPPPGEPLFLVALDLLEDRAGDGQDHVLPPAAVGGPGGPAHGGQEI